MEMKDSGISWVGEIPDNWRVEHIRGCFTCEARKNDRLTRTVAMKFYDGTIVPKPSVELDEQNLRILSGYQFVDKDAIVINGLNLNYDLKSKRVGLAMSDGIITSAYMVINPLPYQVVPRYANYLFKGYDYRKAFHNMGVGIRKTLSWNEFKHVYMPFPSLSEQQRIADYLDERCAAIDEVRRTIEDEVEVLRRLRKATIHRAVTKGLDEGVPMRDSGVEWIGEMPEDWDCCKQKHAMTLINGRAYSNDEFEQDGIYRILRVGNLFSNPDWYTSSLQLPAEKYCAEGDLLYSWSMSYGPHIWHGEKVIYHYHIWKVRLTKRLNMSFAYYYLLALTDAIRSEIHETTMGFLTMGVMNDSYIALPSLSEQQRIADYLDERCAAIDSVIDTRTKQLERLEDYRKALIFAYVTGKKEVPTHA